MRLALLGLAASLSVQPLVAQNLRVSQAPVTITATFVRTGADKPAVDRPNDADVNVRTPAETVSYGNKMVLRATLEAAREEGDEEDVSLTGWSLVAVWANWPETGNGYKFFARKKGETPVLVPDAILKLDLTDAYAGQNLIRRGGKIIGGSDTHKCLAQLTLGGLGTEEDTRYDTHDGIATGVLFGTGEYALPVGASTAVYRPQGDLFVGYGEADAPAPDQDEIINVTLRIGASYGVAASPFAPAPVGPAEGPGATSESTDNISTGAIIIGGSGGLDTVPGGALAGDVTIIVPEGTTGDTANLGAAM